MTGAVEPVPIDWREQALALIRHPALDEVDRVFVHKLLGWRRPGADGWRRLREINERVAKVSPKA